MPEPEKSPLARLAVSIVCVSVAGMHAAAADVLLQNGVPVPANDDGISRILYKERP
jgi:hypothetical protein